MPEHQFKDENLNIDQLKTRKRLDWCFQLSAKIAIDCLILENPSNPFTDKDGNYDWKKTDLPKRVAVIGREILRNHKIRVPPRESIFLDRKLGGAFIFASVIGLNGKSRSGLMKYFG